MSILRKLGGDGRPVCPNCGKTTHQAYAKVRTLPCWNCEADMGTYVAPDSMWLVVYECRYNVVRVTPKGDGFIAPGQDVVWGLGEATEWVREIVPPEE